MKQTKWILDPTHSELGFRIRHLMITNVSGQFQDFSAEVTTRDEDFSTAKIRATVQVGSIQTNNLQRDEHLRNSDFFEVTSFPEALFESERVEKDGEGYRIEGQLTLKGIRKPVRLQAEFNGVTRDPWGGERAGFAISGKINRSDWGVNFNSVLETGGLALSEEVKIHAELQLVKQTEAVPA